MTLNPSQSRYDNKEGRYDNKEGGYDNKEGGYDNKEDGSNNKSVRVYSSMMGTIELVSKLGSGHFGDVWEGLKGEKRIAIKLLQKASQSAILEMLEEISLLG